jgi:uncharacterized protein YjbJ (UPF0337 family)
MNWKQVEGKWDQVRGNIKSRWGKLTDDDLKAAQGRRDALVGKIKERYGMRKEEAEANVDEFIESL